MAREIQARRGVGAELFGGVARRSTPRLLTCRPSACFERQSDGVVVGHELFEVGDIDAWGDGDVAGAGFAFSRGEVVDGEPEGAVGGVGEGEGDEVFGEDEIGRAHV